MDLPFLNSISILIVRGTTVLSAACSVLTAVAQSDSLFLCNGDVIVGELKGMVNDVAYMSTPYSKSDLAIKWDKVARVRTEEAYLAELRNGRRATVQLHSRAMGSVDLLAGPDTITVPLLDVVFLRVVKETLWSRVSVQVGLGYNHTRANDLHQFGLNGLVGYHGDQWQGAVLVNGVTSTQSTTEDIKRGDITGSYRRLLPYRLMVGVDASFLYTTAQRLDLRSSIQPLVGSYLVRTNELFFLIQAGAAFTHEDFSMEEPDRRSTEGLFGLELNLFNTGAVGLLFATKAFPSISEDGRLRVDQRIQFTYDLPKGFYLRTGVTANYDNQAVAGAVDLDYAFQTGIGWKH